MDDNEPIFYAIRFKNNKIFKIILDYNLNYDEAQHQKIVSHIVKHGTVKMLKLYINHLSLDINQKGNIIRTVFDEKVFYLNN